MSNVRCHKRCKTKPVLSRLHLARRTTVACSAVIRNVCCPCFIHGVGMQSRVAIQNGTSVNSSRSSHGPTRMPYAPRTSAPKFSAFRINRAGLCFSWCRSFQTTRAAASARTNQLRRFLSRPSALRAHSRTPNLLPAKQARLMSTRVLPPMHRSSTVAPNPSIEAMPKRLRLLVTPHVKR